MYMSIVYYGLSLLWVKTYSENIFPFFGLSTQQLQKTLFTKKVAKPVNRAQCFACDKEIPKFKYKNKYIICDSTNIRLCEPCSKNHFMLKNKNLIEYTECTICDQEVNYESIFLQLMPIVGSPILCKP